MKYFIDTEFIEGFHKPLFGKRRHFIDLISIGIVCEDGREYYAISTEFNEKDADDWVKTNVISKLPRRATSFYDSPTLRQNCLLYKSNKQIAEDIRKFCFKGQIEFKNNNPVFNNPEFYAYYADYDWVVFCSLFGRMIDLPTGFPMYCRDLKQTFDEKDYQWDGKLKSQLDYPKQTNEHSAIDDAKWNLELYNFMLNL